ncbi:MAG: hypothetical protein GQ527_05430 [Bacteroidales bacterium]|nr:hypothetical protein [Bacteroidales bacterium]
MKRVILPLIFIFIGLNVFAQSTNDYIEVVRSVLKTEKKAIIAETMAFTDKEAEVFWPLYNEFNEKAYVIQSKRIALIKDFADNYETMSDLKADELWTNYLKYQQEIQNLNKQYFKKFKKFMPASKVVKYFQAENKIAALINVQLADQIPFIEIQ